MYKYFFLILFGANAFAQPLRPGEWRAYTAMTAVTGVAATPDSAAVWVATKGGAFMVRLINPSPDSLVALRTIDGLSTNELTCVAADPDGSIYLGGFGGSIDIYSPESGTVRSVKDIVLSNLITNKTINRLERIGDRLYIAANYGLSIYDPARRVFGETVTRFATLPQQDSVFAAAEAGGKIYAVTSGAIAYADRNSPQLSAPFVWQLIPAPPNVSLRTLSVFNGKLVAAGFGGAFIVSADTLERLTLDSSALIADVAMRDGSLYFFDKSANGRVIVTRDLAAFEYRSIEGASLEDPITAFCLTGSESFAYGRLQTGVTLAPGTGIVTDIYPPGPISNEVFNLHYARSAGRLYVAQGNLGIVSFDPATSAWKYYTAKGANAPLPPTRYEKVYYDSQRSVLWASTFGSGLMKCTFDNDVLASVDRKDGNDGLPSTAEDNNPGFVVVGQSALDSKGNLIVAVWAQNGNGIARTSDGETFTSFTLNPGGSRYRPWRVITEDLEGYYFTGTALWTNPPTFGVAYVNPKGEPGALPGGAGGILTSPVVNALDVDQDNNLWCGTSDGVQIVSHFTSSRTGVVEFRSRKLPFLDGQIVLAIATDGVGNKWVGTEKGVFVVSPDGSDSLANYTEANSPLLDNTVNSIAVDAGTGEVYMSTPNGISRTSSIYKEGNPDYSKIYVYPNPIVRSRDERPVVTIAGLVSGSTVKIYTVSGRLLKTIDGTLLGSTVTWDGRDENGNELASGVYLVGATSQLAAESGQAKFVLIRK